MKKFCILAGLLLAISLPTNAQYAEYKGAFKRLDFSVSAGTTGVGFELATPVFEDINLRAGFSFVPEFNPVMTFDVESRNQNGEVTSFESLSDRVQGFLGYEIDDEVDMEGSPSFYNFNVMLDFHPFKNKNWHLTAGVYIGPNEIACAYNKREETASLLALGMYNNMYDKILNDEPLYDDIYIDPDLGDRFLDKGRLGIYVGEFDDNDKPYMMEPDKNGMVKVRMKTNTFIRPYLGFGYGGRLIKNDDRCHVSFDCGAMFWGGVPKVLTHDGVDLVDDLHNIRGQVDNYVKLLKHFPIYPVMNLKISYKLF